MARHIVGAFTCSQERSSPLLLTIDEIEEHVGAAARAEGQPFHSATFVAHLRRAVKNGKIVQDVDAYRLPLPCDQKWMCDSCTFVNSPARATCEVCEAPRVANEPVVEPVATASAGATASLVAGVDSDRARATGSFAGLLNH